MLRHSYDEIVQACQDYRAAVKAGDVMRADWHQFAGWIGEAAEDLERLMLPDEQTQSRAADDADADETAKRGEAGEALKRLATFIRGEYATSPYWGGALSAKSIFLQKQAFDGRPMVDRQDVRQSGELSVRLEFGETGDGDPFG